MFEVKETVSADPIRVLVYGQNGQCTEILAPKHSEGHDAPVRKIERETPQPVDNGPESST